MKGSVEIPKSCRRPHIMGLDKRAAQVYGRLVMAENYERDVTPAHVTHDMLDAGVRAFRAWEDAEVRRPEDAYPFYDPELERALTAVYLAMVGQGRTSPQAVPPKEGDGWKAQSGVRAWPDRQPMSAEWRAAIAIEGASLMPTKTIDSIATLKALYRSEINASISWCWDGGFYVELGDYANEVVAFGTFSDMDVAIAWLREQAIEHYPDIEFAAEQKSDQPGKSRNPSASAAHARATDRGTGAGRLVPRMMPRS